MPHRGPSVRPAHDAAAQPPLTALLDEVRLLWRVMSQVAERLHDEEGVSLGMRAVLESLSAQGTATVPDLARRRRVSRQHIQLLVNALAERGLVAAVPNPAHRRSTLFELTHDGRETVDRMARRELRLLERLTVAGGPEAVTRASATLRSVREQMETT